MKRKIVVNNMPNAAPQAAGNEHLKQAKQSMAENAVQLKKQIAAIREQSLKTLQDSVHTVFRDSNAANLQQMAIQHRQVLAETRQKEYGNKVNAAGVPIKNPGASSENGAEQTDAGKQALAIANKGAQQALESAKLGFAEVKKLLSNLNKKKKP